MQKNNKTNIDLYPTTNPSFNHTCESVHKGWCKETRIAHNRDRPNFGRRRSSAEEFGQMFGSATCDYSAEVRQTFGVICGFVFADYSQTMAISPQPNKIRTVILWCPVYSAYIPPFLPCSFLLKKNFQKTFFPARIWRPRYLGFRSYLSAEHLRRAHPELLPSNN